MMFDVLQCVRVGVESELTVGGLLGGLSHCIRSACVVPNDGALLYTNNEHRVNRMGENTTSEWQVIMYSYR